jgi:vancomycin resistance protein YoaR
MDAPSPSAARRPRRLWFPLAIAAGALALAGLVALAALALAERGRLPANATVAGVDVGSMKVEEARALVRAAAARRLHRPIVLTAPGLELETSGRELGAEPDVDDALERADDAGLLARLRARIGLADEQAVAVRFRLDQAELSTLHERLARRLDREPRSAEVRVRAGVIAVVPGEEGATVRFAALERTLAQLPATVGVPLATVSPEISTAAATRARRVAESLLGESRTIRAGARDVVLRPGLLRRALRFEPDARKLVVTLSTDVLAQALRPRLRRLELPARDAQLVVAGKRVRVRPSRPGRELDLERIASSLVRNRSSRVHRARFVPVAPALTTEQAERLRVTQLVSEFTTYYSCCQPRVTNIQRAAELLDGTIIRPRGTFSMNEALGKRTEENGFVAAPQIYNGRLEDAVGGGISQMATTLYNAAFFAGIKLVAHQAHQFYISRYPMGREATVSWGGPELVFRNDWPAAILMKVSAGDTSVTVRFYSTKLGRRVETETGEPYAFRAPETITISNPSLPPGTTSVVQSAGASGFTVQYTRKVFRGADLVKDERYTVRYDAQNAIVEVGPPKKAVPAKPKPPKAKRTPPVGGDPADGAPGEGSGAAEGHPAREAAGERSPAG